MLGGALQTLQAVATAPQRPGWEKLMGGCLIAGAFALALAVVFLIGHPKRSTSFLRNAREWLAARLWPPLLVLSAILFVTAGVAAIVR